MNADYSIQVNLMYILVPTIVILNLLVLVWLLSFLYNISTWPEKLPTENTENGKMLIDILKSKLEWDIYNPENLPKLVEGLSHKNIVIKLRSGNEKDRLWSAYPYICDAICSINGIFITLNRKDQVEIFNLALPILKSIRDKEEAAKVRKDNATLALEDFKATLPKVTSNSKVLEDMVKLVNDIEKENIYKKSQEKKFYSPNIHPTKTTVKVMENPCKEFRSYYDHYYGNSYNSYLTPVDIFGSKKVIDEITKEEDAKFLNSVNKEVDKELNK